MKKYPPLIPLIIVILLFFTVSSLLMQTGRNTKDAIVDIKEGMPASKIVDLLRTNDVIKSRTNFKLLSYMLGLQDKIQAGRYKFKPHETMFGVLLKLVKGETVQPEPLKVTFPEGTSIYKMGSILGKAGYPRFEEFRKYGAAKKLEGYLFPDTYIFGETTSVEVIVDMEQKRFDETIKKYWDENKTNAELSFYETLILASIVEKEAVLDAERPVIASVFYNRLKMKMPLAADPTIKYALERPTKRVYTNQLNIASPYNTYKRRGLPPTPICNPGLSSFKAAIFPASTNYLYFVAKKDGSHVFSSSWEKHQKARVKSTPTQ